jgi:mycothiol system anti-sigma-R factor
MDNVPETLDCHAAMRRLWEYVDGELSGKTLQAVHAHLAICADCYRHFAFERQFLAALEAAQAQECAPARLHKQVLEALCAEGFTPEYGER